jgi:hypothetical protein
MQIARVNIAFMVMMFLIVKGTKRTCGDSLEVATEAMSQTLLMVCQGLGCGPRILVVPIRRRAIVAGSVATSASSGDALRVSTRSSHSRARTRAFSRTTCVSMHTLEDDADMDPALSSREWRSERNNKGEWICFMDFEQLGV